MKTVLITGAAGFVGSHLVDRCLQDGYQVVGIDDFSSGLRENLFVAMKSKRFFFMNCDMTRPSMISSIRSFLKKHGISSIHFVIHLAAEKIPRYGNRLRTLHVNILSTFSALELVKNFRSTFVFASTSDVYGLTEAFPFREDSLVVYGPSEVARWAYGSSKYLGEQLVYAYHEEYGLPAVMLRIFGVYGPRQVKGWKGNAVSAFFEQAHKGAVYELHGSGSQTRSFLYIDDLIDALKTVLVTSWKKPTIINIGSRETISMRKLARTIHRLTRPKISFVSRRVLYQSFTGRPYQDIQRKLPDIQRATRLLRWKPRVPLLDGLRKTEEWYKTLHT